MKKNEELEPKAEQNEVAAVKTSPKEVKTASKKDKVAEKTENADAENEKPAQSQKVKDTKAAKEEEKPEAEASEPETPEEKVSEEPEAIKEEKKPEAEASEPEAAKEEEKPEAGVSEPEAAEEKVSEEPEAAKEEEKPEAEVSEPEAAEEKVSEEPETAKEEKKPEAGVSEPETPEEKVSEEPEAAKEEEKPEAGVSEPEAAEENVSEEPETAKEEEKLVAGISEPETPEEKVSEEPEAAKEEEKPEAEVSEPEAAEEKVSEEPETAKEEEKPEAEVSEPKGSAPPSAVREYDSDDSDALIEKYGSMNREGLVVTIEDLVQNDDVNYIRNHIGFIKVAYRKLLRDENMAAYEQRLSKDKDDKPEEAVADELTERFDKAFNIYKEKKIAWDKALEKEMQDNLQVKEEILDSLRELIESEEELKKTYDQFNELQERWRTVGPVPRGSKSTLWNNYHFLVEKFFDKVNINKELKDLDLKKNLEAKTKLCEKAEELFLETSVTRSFQQLQKLHEAWKEIGPVPKDKKDEVWERFRSSTEKLNKRRQEHYDKLREEQNKNYAAKLVLCEKAEEVLTYNPETPKQWQERTNQINELFKVWKTIGFAPKKVNNEVWNRFRNTLDTFFTNKKEFFRKYKDQQRDNYNQKLNLCMQAEALKDSQDWRATTEALINLQNEWKKIGPVPAKFSDKIWKRFRQACDHFFNRKSDHFSNIGDQQNKNLKDKLDLIEQIKSYDYTDDNKENLNVLKGFQRTWMDIGHVPIKQKDKVQVEFRKAIDNQFEVLNISKKAKSTLSFRTKIDNLKNVQNADAIIQKERNFITNKIKNLQSDIKVLENNIGFFASSKKADILKAEFEEKIDKARNEIGVLKEKMKILRDS
jgi:hypothetical protein